MSTTNRKTRLVEFWADLHPGWHKNPASPVPCIHCTPPSWSQIPGAIRVQILVNLPEVEVQGVSETLQAAILTDEPVADPFESEKGGAA